MKFRELPIGGTFRFFVRGQLLTKTSPKTYASGNARNQPADPEVGVIPYDVEPAEVVTDPFGETNEVEFGKKAVRLDGVFTAEQLEVVLAALRKRKG